MNFEILNDIKEEQFKDDEKMHELYLRFEPERNKLYKRSSSAEAIFDTDPEGSLMFSRQALLRITKFYWLEKSRSKNDYNPELPELNEQQTKEADKINKKGLYDLWDEDKKYKDYIKEAFQKKKEEEIIRKVRKNQGEKAGSDEKIKEEKKNQIAKEVSIEYGNLYHNYLNVKNPGNEAEHIDSNLEGSEETAAYIALVSLHEIMGFLLSDLGLVEKWPRFRSLRKKEESYTVEMDETEEANNLRDYSNAIVEKTEDGQYKISFSDSEEYYIGNVKSGKPHGEGIYHYSDNSSYEGLWKNGMPNGQGKMIYENGKIYDGEWKNGKRHGKAIYSTFSDNTGTRAVITANWKEDCLDDENGELLYEDGYKYIGGLKGKGTLNKSGKGTIYRANGSIIFKGQWIDGKATGYFEQYYENGQIQKKGNMSKGKWEGNGKTYYKNGQLEYEGGFKNSCRNGFGKVYREDGSLLYEGNFENNDWNGYGKKYSEDGTIIYEGTYKDGRASGEGKSYYDDGTLWHEGTRVDGKFDGYGKEYYKNGQLMYEGSYKTGKWNGYGKKYREDGSLAYEGYFLDNEENGEGKEYYENGQLKYEGNIIKNEWNGYGRKYREDGSLIYEGYYRDGKPYGEGKGYYYKGGKITYKGGYKNSQYDGFGKLYSEDGTLKYSGTFTDSKKEGTGKEYYHNGQIKYNGMFSNDKWNGFGKYYREDGVIIFEGYYNNSSAYAGKWFKNGKLFYDGEFKNGKMNGYGVRYNADGTLHIGFFEDGSPVIPGVCCNKDFEIKEYFFYASKEDQQKKLPPKEARTLMKGFLPGARISDSIRSRLLDLAKIEKTENFYPVREQKEKWLCPIINSGTNQEWFDERKFVRIYNSEGFYEDEVIQLESDSTYQVRVLVRNDSENQFNITTAENVRLSLYYPMHLEKGEQDSFVAKIFSDNARYREIGVKIAFFSQNAVDISFVENSLNTQILYEKKNSFSEGKFESTLSEDIFSKKGALVGNIPDNSGVYIDFLLQIKKCENDEEELIEEQSPASKSINQEKKCPICFNRLPERDYLVAKETKPDLYYRTGPIMIDKEESFWILTMVCNDCPDEVMVAKDVRLSMKFERISDTEISVESIIRSSNAEPPESKHTIHFLCDQPFELQYLAGSACLYSEAFGGLDSRKGYFCLSDDILTPKGALLGFNTLDGQIRGGSGNNVSVSIKVNVLRR